MVYVICTVRKYPGYWTKTIRWQTILKNQMVWCPMYSLSISCILNRNHQVKNHIQTIWFDVLCIVCQYILNRNHQVTNHLKPFGLQSFAQFANILDIEPKNQVRNHFKNQMVWCPLHSFSISWILNRNHQVTNHFKKPDVWCPLHS